MARIDPYAGFRFVLEIDGIVQGSFSQVSGFGSRVQPIEYREGGDAPTVRKLPGLVSYPDVTLRWGVTDSRELYDWHMAAVAGHVDRKNGSIVLFGGMAKERPYPGSTTVTTVNGGVVGLTRTLVEELRPIRVNSVHPGVVGNSPYWAEKPAAIAKYTSETPLGRLARMDEIVDAAVFLLENTAVNGVDLIVDGGWHCR